MTVNKDNRTEYRKSACKHWPHYYLLLQFFYLFFCTVLLQKRKSVELLNDNHHKFYSTAMIQRRNRKQVRTIYHTYVTGFSHLRTNQLGIVRQLQLLQPGVDRTLSKHSTQPAAHLSQFPVIIKTKSLKRGVFGGTKH